MTTNLGSDATCQRTTGPCVEKQPHRAGEHLDPRHPLYDGPNTTIDALNAAPRRAAYALIRAGAPVPEVVDLVEEIHRLKAQTGHLMVDADRRERAAIERALDCTAHGERIAELEKQADQFWRDANRNNEARMAVISAFHPLQKAVSELRDRVRAGRELPDGSAIVEVFGKALDRISAAHERAWKK
jgi:hypothetical protein